MKFEENIINSYYEFNDWKSKYNSYITVYMNIVQIAFKFLIVTFLRKH